jgi:hypothetical protein
MSKVKTKKKHESENQVNVFDNLNEKYKILIAAIVLLIPLVILYASWETNNLRPTGTDHQGSIGKTHIWKEWSNETGETVLWNPNIFAGMPIYPRIMPYSIHIDSLIRILSKVISSYIWYLFLGGIGMFFLLRNKSIPWYLAIITALVFMLLPDWQAQIGEGHNAKLRALMILPWFFLSFDYLFNKTSWLSTGFFAFIFVWLVRTAHFQVVFYGILVLFFIYIYPTVKLLLDKKFKQFGDIALKFSIALALTLFMSAQPLLTTNEYAEYSTRGGNPVKIGEEAKSAEQSAGVSFDYATMWSFSPKEILDFFIPRFTGGISGEKYDGDKYPNFKGQQVPGYWGDKPFSGNYASMGMILFLFAVIGVIFYRQDKFVLALAAFTVFSLFLSFGRHFPELYKLFYYYVPFFSKFRAPAMIVNITFISVLILSGFGLKAIVKQVSEKDFKVVFTVLGIGLAIPIVVWLMSDSFAYLTARESSQYNPNQLAVMKEIRKEFLLADTQKLLFFTLVMIAAVAGFLFKKIRTEAFAVIILILAGAEIFTISKRAHDHIAVVNPDQLERTYFKDNSITQFLKEKPHTERAMVIGRDFTSNLYAYFHPLISGYSPIKLQVIQDLVDHNLYKGPGPSRLNWNVINMLNGKYIISPAQLEEPFLSSVAMNQEKQEVLYINSTALPKAWFVKDVMNFNTPEELVMFMNTNEFKPDSIALVVNGNSGLVKEYDGNGKVEVVNITPNTVELKVETEAEQFLVLSEVYYPEGWTATLDGEDVPIEKVNHILRGVKVKQGSYNLLFDFHPPVYFAALTTLWIGNILIIALILVFGYLEWKKRKDAEEIKST